MNIAPAAPRDSGDIDMTKALFGSDLTEGIVAVETSENSATLFVRRAGAAVVQQVVPFEPWVLVREPRELPEIAGQDSLTGVGYNQRIRFQSWKTWQDGRRILREERRDVLSYGSSSKQFLMATGRTLFKGMAFSDIHRMQVDIETSYLSPVAPEAKIFMIVASDNREHEAVLVGDEHEMLQELTQLIQNWDPDVLEGHNIFGFDLPYIRARAKALDVALAWGRLNAESGERAMLSTGQERNCSVGANTRPFTPHYIWGRHIVDTLFQTQRFDVARGEISSYGLKECAIAYHIAEPERVYLDRSDIVAEYRRDPERVRAYALADVRETRRLAEIVCPTEFYQTQMVPDVYQNVAVTGSGEKINSIFVRAYLEHDHAIPRQQGSTSYSGGYTELRESGVIHRIVKADVESLYPSIMLANKIAPSSDSLGIFLPLLRDLRERRLTAKVDAKKAADGREFSYWNGLQESFKLLINSFYGYLGAPFYFNDYKAASRVTEIGQGIVKKIVADLELAGSRIIEIDTDGVYFQPPAEVEGEEAEEQFVNDIGSTLPEGIRLAFDGRYAVMLSLKAKNYILIGYDGKKIFKGSSLRSRADERFGRRFLTEAVDLLLRSELTAMSALYNNIYEKIARRELGIEQITRRERVTDKTFNSDARKRSAQALAGLKVGEYADLYQREDHSLALGTNYANDDDIEYYQTKLYKFAQRLEAAIGPEFEQLFPKPLTGAKRKAKEDAKHQMNLFDF